VLSFQNVKHEQKFLLLAFNNNKIACCLLLVAWSVWQKEGFGLTSTASSTFEQTQFFFC